MLIYNFTFLATVNIFRSVLNCETGHLMLVLNGNIKVYNYTLIAGTVKNLIYLKVARLY